ncbi:MAG: hypothetical protein AMXMBFR64_13080 [Myxococcales bacterium]
MGFMAETSVPIAQAAAGADGAGVSDLTLIVGFAAALLALGAALIFTVRLTRRRGEVRVDAAAVLRERPPDSLPMDHDAAEGHDDEAGDDGDGTGDDDDHPQPQRSTSEGFEGPGDSPAVQEVDEREPLDPLDDLGDLLEILPPPPPAAEEGDAPGAAGSRVSPHPSADSAGDPERSARTSLVATASRLAAEGSWTAAAACYREAGDLANAALCYRRAGDLRKVIECLEDIGDHYRVGRILARRGDPARAEQAFERVDPGHPKYAKALLLRARLAWDLRQADRSAELVRAFLRLATDEAQIRDARKLLAKLLEVQHRYGEAMELLLALQVERPKDATVGRRLERVRARIEDQVRRVDVPLMVPEIDVTASGVTIGPTEHDVSTANERPTDRYELFELVGEGSLGRLYKGYDHDLSELVAVKFLESWGQSPAIAREAFREAVRRAAEVRHRGIVGVRDMGELEGHPFLATDYIIGRSLDRRLAQGQPAHPKLLLAVAMQLGAALDHLHDVGLVHGDVKPTNILLRDEPENALVLTDVGLVQALRVVDPRLIGADDSDAYRAPEVGGVIDGAADVFSLGVLIYRMLTGALPFAGRPAPGSPPPTPPWMIRRDIDPALGRVVLQCLDPRRDLRPGRAGEVAGAVRTALIRTL